MTDEVKMSRTVEEIKRRLKINGKQHKHLAEAAGISPSAVSQLLSFRSNISKERILEFSTVLGGEPEFWIGLIEEDMAEKEQKDDKRLCTVFRATNGEKLPVRHVDYREDPEAAGRYMASILIQLNQAGWTADP